ncbi:MAG: hypothetical protein FWG87_02865 [Defluviitaleaceae bacterium]|nr:hypothetical protein [Defluviitaleaceae bacterium]
MRCYCYETETEFIYCVEGAEGKIYEKLQADPYWKSSGDKFLKIYPMNTGWHDAWYVVPEYKEAVVSNFARMGKSWIEGVFDWKGVLLLLAEMFARNGIEWYIIGSVGEAVRGVDIAPHDIDIGVHTRDFYKVRDLTREYVIEPLGDNKGNWIVRYFGKLCIDGASVDIAADEKLNMENRKYPCDRVSWSGYDLFVEPLQKRYEVELQRGREDRIRAMEEFMKRRA